MLPHKSSQNTLYHLPIVISKAISQIDMSFLERHGVDCFDFIMAMVVWLPIHHLSTNDPSTLAYARQVEVLLPQTLLPSFWRRS